MAVISRLSPIKIPFRRRMARSSVAMIHRLAENESGGRELLFIQRATRNGDPWSGDMAFPGGRMHAADASTRAAAERETLEETGLDLAEHGHIERRLSDRLTREHHRWRPMVVTPYLYHWRGPADPVLNHEVETLLWIPLSALTAPKNQARMRFQTPLGRLRLRCVRYEGYCIWGLSYSMLREYLRIEGSNKNAN